MLPSNSAQVEEAGRSLRDTLVNIMKIIVTAPEGGVLASWRGFNVAFLHDFKIRSFMQLGSGQVYVSLQRTRGGLTGLQCAYGELHMR
ncbi:hypothetical protein N7478_008602 [Penicillium angulare]|uniref:uncharacterized protein n=1 Tax=Penicillium angulare TaxID=116970 RepID=UPI002540A87B|nr:uncharacterized protein N7478_008602 [Penicillium angulare]KAJ5273477.1 hypothetical protein N7478_008602 [Penicillium angulare]